MGEMKTRLNQAHRQILLEFLKDNIALPEMEADEAAYEAAEKLVARDVRKKFPPRDMKVLAKYGKAHAADRIKGMCPNGDVVGFGFRDRTAAPQAPDYDNSIILLADDTAAAVEASRQAEEKREAAWAKVYGDYKALILSATTFAQVVEDWPAARVLEDKICSSRELTVLSQEARARIRATNVGRAAAEGGAAAGKAKRRNAARASKAA